MIAMFPAKAQRRKDKTLPLRLCALAGVLLFILAPSVTLAQYKPTDYTRTEAMIPMRDGVRLYTTIDAPAQAPEPLPILLLRIPYGLGTTTAEQLATALTELSSEGYIFVRQDIRGRFKSEGEFVMLRQPRDPKDKNAIDESTDTYDTIAYLLNKVPKNNGRVGMAGTSYGAWLSVMGMLDPHPALKAVVQQASPADMWLGDDFHHNGCARMFVKGDEPTTVENVLDHFDQVRKLIGADHLGVGSDIDLYGYATPAELNRQLRAGYKGSYASREKIDVEGLDHPKRMFDLTKGLIRRKYSDADIEVEISNACSLNLVDRMSKILRIDEVYSANLEILSQQLTGV